MKFKDLEAAIKFDHFNFVIFLEKEKKTKNVCVTWNLRAAFDLVFQILKRKKEKKTYFYTPSVYIESERRK